MKQNYTEENVRRERKRNFLGGEKRKPKEYKLKWHMEERSQVMYSQNEAILNENGNQLK